MAAAIIATAGRAAIYFSDLETAGNKLALRHWDRCGLSIDEPYKLKEDAADWAFMRIQPIMLQACVIRRSNYLECGGLPERMRVREDTLLFYKLALLFPACAVAGSGMRQMDDAPVRLTRQLHEFTIDYCLDTITMYKTILELGGTLKPERRQRVVNELSNAHFGAARAYYRERFYRQSLLHLWRSATTSRRACAECFRQSLARAVSRHKGETPSTSLAKQ
jgi:hypothetical protein